MLEDSVKKLRSPKTAPGTPLPKPQAESALTLLADWLLESVGAVSPSALCHPKFQSFLQQVGLPEVSPRNLVLPHLSARYHELHTDSEVRIREAAFFQLASDGWKSSATSAESTLVSLAVNLPNGTTVFHRPLITTGGAPSSYAEEVLWDSATKLCGGMIYKCAGIVADRFKWKALRNLESRNQWMVNLPCQVQALRSLIKDFARDLPLFRRVSANCSKLSNFVNSQSQARSIFLKYQKEEQGHARLLRTALSSGDSVDKFFVSGSAMLDDVLSFGRSIQMSVLDENYRLLSADVPIASEIAEMVQNVEFWTELEAVHSLVRLIKSMAREVEIENPLVGQCLPLWDELRSKVKGWSAKYDLDGALAESVLEKRFIKNYHPAWSAAFALDPVYLAKDASGKYVPPFKCLTTEQEKDVDRLITRLVSPEEAHIALMELMKWRSEGLDPLYAQAVQVKQHDPATGKMRMANPQSRRLVWETCLSDFKCLPKVAVRLIFLHATSCAFKLNSSMLWLMGAHGQSGTAQKMAFVMAHSKIERRDFSTEEEKDAEFLADVKDGVLSEAVAEASVV